MVTPGALVVEDDKDVAELYGHVLTALGFQTEIVRAGTAALAHLDTIIPAVVILDLHLPPPVGGIDVLRQIRADLRLAHTRVIVVTGHPELAETVCGKADGVLLKPIDVDQLSALVGKLYPIPNTIEHI